MSCNVTFNNSSSSNLSSNQISQTINGDIKVYFTQTMLDNTLGVGENYQMKADVLNANNTNILWESSNTNVLTVDSQGVVEGVSVGKAVLYAISEEDETKNAGLTITVVERKSEDKIKVTLSEESHEALVGESFSLIATVDNYVSNSDVSWTSFDSSIASVSDGIVKAKGVGQTLIKATSVENEEKYATCIVVVKENINKEIIVSINGASSTVIGVDETLQLSSTVENYKTDNGVTWSSSNTNVLTISTSGLITGISQGTSTITATSKENVAKSCSIQFTVVEQKNGYKLVWKDDFNGTSLDTNNWSYQIGDGSMYGIPGWGNSEQQYYQERNVTVSDGNLIITAKKESVGDKAYTSGRIRSYKKVSKTYGRVEARIKLPSGAGLWPAFWMLPDTTEYGSWPNSGEIDIMEAKGRLLYETSGALHYAYDNGSHHYETATNYFQGSDQITDYHIYAIEWDEGEIRWYCDSNNFMTLKSWSITGQSTSKTSPFDKDFHILFNLACGGHFDEYRNPSDDVLPAEMRVDYVKWYQK